MHLNNLLNLLISLKVFTIIVVVTALLTACNDKNVEPDGITNFIRFMMVD